MDNNGNKNESNDFCVGFFCTLVVVGAIAAALLVILNFP